ncbi:type II toxin-antitoxin system prevent-host-death family antitoxin [Actinokineospora enzanensis]|uniref:type II toxin-antitoxin system prevent-host-death family antitoxin n=1 Tax=Actinokineospora enzanensis TaxID=155975 RepID=UPI000A0111F6
MPVGEARERPGEGVSRVRDERTVITWRGKSVAAVVAIDDLRRLEAAEDEADLVAAQEAVAAAQPRVSHQDVLAAFGGRTDEYRDQAP